MSVIIMSGIPGSGKTTYIQNHLHGAEVVSADHFFEDPVTRVYKFDPKHLADAHKYCMRSFIDACDHFRDNERMIVVDNTAISIAEIAPYYLVGESLHHRVKILTLNCDPRVAARRNIHNVPEHIIMRMRRDLVERRLMPWWEEQKVEVE